MQIHADANDKVAVDDIALMRQAWKSVKALHREFGDIPKICRVAPGPLTLNLLTGMLTKPQVPRPRPVSSTQGQTNAKAKATPGPRQ